MPFIPKLPTWHNTVIVYRKTAGNWALADPIVGQVYTPLRNSDNEQDGMVYLQFRKEDVALLRDPFDGVADVVGITYPGGSVKGFRVVEILPRWLGFPNQHLIATLKRMTAAEYTGIVDNEELPDAEGPEIQPAVSVATYILTDTPGEWLEGPTISAVVKPAGLEQPGTPFGALSLFYSTSQHVLRDAAQLGQDAFYDTLGELDIVAFEWPTGSGQTRRYWVLQTFPVELGGDNEHVKCMLKELLPEQWEAATIIEPPDPGDLPDEWTLTVEGTANATCAECESLDNTYILAFDAMLDWWTSETFAGVCSGEVEWRMDFVVGTLRLFLFDHELGGGSICAAWFSVPGLPGWDGVSPLTLSLQPDVSDSRCDWPDTVSIEPV